ncbi:MAG: AbgT family transporter [Bacteroides sp.]|nr:AbgT family transporter [Bacteroides sp.]
MKSSRFSSTLTVVFFLLTLALVLFSWIGNIYGLGEVQSLLSAEGIRWVLGHVVENYVLSPILGIVLVLFMGLGIVLRSGLYDAVKRFVGRNKLLSRKERRALTLAVSVLLLYLSILVVSMFLPWNLYWNITGGWSHSPFSKGLVYLLSIGMGLAGVVYGYVSDTFRCLSDVVEGMASLIAERSFSFVSLFFIIQFFSSLEYTRLAEWLNVDGRILMVLYGIFCILALFRFDSSRAHV